MDIHSLMRIFFRQRKEAIAGQSHERPNRHLTGLSYGPMHFAVQALRRKAYALGSSHLQRCTRRLQK